MKLDDEYEGALPVGMRVPETEHFERVVRAMVAVNCWHEEESESDALWRIYSAKEEAVAIRTSAGALRQAMPSRNVTVSRVHYVDPHNFEVPAGFHPYLYKRHFYRHEREVRAIALPDVTRELADVRTPIPPPTAVNVSVDLRTLVREVLISPYAEPWFLRTVEDLVHGLHLPVPVRYSPMRPHLGE
ncbi:MAG: hypothetical protein QOF60_3473 [Actinomycetota bacterium]|nr:hypothetical protein [Actinomycetota bacterium]